MNRSIKFSIGVLLVTALLASFGCVPKSKDPNILFDFYSAGRWFSQTSPRYQANIAYVENGSRAQYLDVAHPEGEGPWPVIIFVHGGSWQLYSPSIHAALAQSFTDRGYLTVLVEYRKFPEVVYPGFVDDTVLALNYAMDHITEWGGDPERVLVAGHSAGAHLVAVAFTDDTFRRQFTFDPMSIRGLAPLSGPLDFPGIPKKLGKVVIQIVMGGKENYNKANAINYPRADVPPLFLPVGEKDNVCPPAQVKHYADAMKMAGADVTYLEIPGGDHMTMLLHMTRGHEGPELDALMGFAGKVLTPGS